jgi:hypothetical protein
MPGKTMTDRTKPGMAFWATVVVVVAMILYPLSMGPAFYLADWLGNTSFMVVYVPLEWVAREFDPSQTCCFGISKSGESMLAADADHSFTSPSQTSCRDQQGHDPRVK